LAAALAAAASRWVVDRQTPQDRRRRGRGGAAHEEALRAKVDAAHGLTWLRALDLVGESRLHRGVGHIPRD